MLWKTLQKWMEQAGPGSSVRTLLEEARKLKVVDVFLPTSTGRTLKLTCVSTPDPALQVLLQRLAPPQWLQPMLAAIPKM